MKKISIICCFILSTVFSAGSFLIYKCYLHSYKKEFTYYISQIKNQSAQTSILINPSELYSNSSNIVWEDGNKEVVYKGILYDIIQIENRGLKVALIAVSDTQEMSLKKQFSELFDLDFNKTTKNPYLLLKSFFTLKCVVNHLDFNLSAISLLRVEPYSVDSFLIPTVFFQQETPPPDFLI